MNLGHILLITGAALIILGLLFTGMLSPLGRLPGDILIERENTTIYIPVATMLIISLAITLVMWFMNGRSQ